MARPSLALDLAAALDPVRFAERCGIVPDPWQADVLRSDARQLILCCSRQSGKSTVTGLLALWTALYQPGALVLIVSPSLRQSQELYRKVRDLLRVLKQPEPSEESALRLELPNGSRLVSLPGSERTIRGFSAPLLVIEDEAARVDDALYIGIRPMLATSGGRLVLLSTPFGQRGHFSEAWNGGDGWQRFSVPAERCPRIDPAWLQRERDAMPDFLYRQEYACEFVDSDTQYFATRVIDAALIDGAPLFGGSDGTR